MLCPLRSRQSPEGDEALFPAALGIRPVVSLTKPVAAPQLQALSAFSAIGNQPNECPCEWTPTLLRNFTPADFSKLINRIGLYLGRNTDSQSGYVVAAAPLWKGPATGVPPFNDAQSAKLECITCRTTSMAQSVVSGFVNYSEKSTLRGDGVIASAKVTEKKTLNATWSNSSQQQGSQYTDVVQRVFSMISFPTAGFSLSPEATRDLAEIFRGVDGLLDLAAQMAGPVTAPQPADLNTSAPQLETAFKLLNFFYKYGQYHPQTVVAGGKMYSTYSRDASTVNLGSQSTQTQTISVGVSAESFGSSVSKSISYAVGSSMQGASSQGTTDAELSISWVGSTVWATDERQWQHNLLDASSWATVELQDVMHITEVLPSVVQAQVNAVFQEPAVVQVFGGMDNWQLCELVANTYDGQIVQIIQGAAALGVVALTDLAPTLTPATLPAAQRCLWRPLATQPNAILWSVQSDGMYVELLTYGLNSVLGYLTADAQGNVFIDIKRTTNATFRKWMIKPTTTGQQLINMGNFQMLSSGTQQLAVAPVNAPAPLSPDVLAIPSPLSATPADGSLCNADPNHKGFLVCAGTGLWQTGDFCITQWAESTDLGVFDQALQLFFGLVQERLTAVFNTPSWQALVTGLQTQPITAFFKVWDSDKDTLQNQYPVSLASFAGNWQDLSAVLQAFQTTYQGPEAQFKNYVKAKKSKIKVKWIGYRCVLPAGLAAPFTGPCPVAATAPVTPTPADPVLAMAAVESRVIWPEAVVPSPQPGPTPSPTPAPVPPAGNAANPILPVAPIPALPASGPASPWPASPPTPAPAPAPSSQTAGPAGSTPPDSEEDDNNPDDGDGSQKPKKKSKSKKSKK